MKSINKEYIVNIYNKIEYIEELPLVAKEIINNYFSLNFFDKKISSPYFINEDKKFKFHRVSAGKGTPREIENLTKIISKKKHFNLRSASEDEIKLFMKENNIGIDCSGFVIWILNSITIQKFHKPIWKFINFGEKNIFQKIRNIIRPIENMDVKTIDRNCNTINISSLKDIKPGDLIITSDRGHILLVTKVGFYKKNVPIYFEYVNSKTNKGVKKDLVIIDNLNEDLNQQKWIDLTSYKINDPHFINQNHVSGKLVRLKILDE